MSAKRAVAQACSTLDHVWRHPAVRDRRARAVARYLAWQVWQRVGRRPWTVAYRNGVRLRVYPHSTSAAAALYCGLPDWQEMRFMLDHLRDGDTFVDVGANVGAYTLLAASVPGVRCVAFEPSTESWGRLLENVGLNGLTQVDVVRAAVGADNGETKLTVGCGAVNRVVEPGGSADGAATERVPVVRLDDALADVERVSMIKIDVEGLEPAVLRGAAATIRRHSPALIIEYNDPVQLCTMLGDAGYRICRYDPFTRRVEFVDPDRQRMPNILALKRLGVCSS